MAVEPPKSLQEVLAQLRAEFDQILPGRVQEIVSAVEQALAQTSFNKVLWQEARELVHKLRGTAGSFGHMQITEACATLEEQLNELIEQGHLQNAKPVQNTLQEILALVDPT